MSIWCGVLVLPGSVLRGLIRRENRLSSALQAMALCDKCMVSPEVLLKRIAEDEDLIETDSAVVFAESRSGVSDAKILAACFNLSLRAYLPLPKLFSSLREWLGDHLKGDLSSERTEKWWESISAHEGLRFVATPWGRRSGTFFVEVKFILL